MTREIQQILCPWCGHKQDITLVMTDEQLMKWDQVESFCEQCGESFYRLITDTAG